MGNIRMKIISDGTWFKAGTEVTCIDDYRLENYDAGLFEGVRVVEHDYEVAMGWKLGEERIDQEVCQWEEFNVVEV